MNNFNFRPEKLNFADQIISKCKEFKIKLINFD